MKTCVLTPFFFFFTNALRLLKKKLKLYKNIMFQKFLQGFLNEIFLEILQLYLFFSKDTPMLSSRDRSKDTSIISSKLIPEIYSRNLAGLFSKSRLQIYSKIKDLFPNDYCRNFSKVSNNFFKNKFFERFCLKTIKGIFYQLSQGFFQV